MFHRSAPVFTLILCLMAGVVRAAPSTDGALMTGGALATLCTSKEASDQFACQSYLAGVIDYHRLLRSLGASPSVDFCLPDSVKMAEVKDVVVRYLARFTEHRDFIAAPAVAMSLFRQYPCKRRR